MRIDELLRRARRISRPEADGVSIRLALDAPGLNPGRGPFEHVHAFAHDREKAIPTVLTASRILELRYMPVAVRAPAAVPGMAALSLEIGGVKVAGVGIWKVLLRRAVVGSRIVVGANLSIDEGKKSPWQRLVLVGL